MLENSFDQPCLCNDGSIMLKIMILSGIISVLAGVGLIAFGFVKNNLVGYILGAISFLVTILTFGIVLIILLKYKKDRKPKINQMSMQFFEHKETSFERNYFGNDTAFSHYHTPAVNEWKLYKRKLIVLLYSY